MLEASRFAESPESVGIDPERLTALVARVRREVDEGLLPSVQFALAREGRIAAAGTFGRVTALGRPAEATNDTLYTLFSATKAIIASAGWILLGEGKLGLDERVAEIVPEFGSNGKHVVRVEQLFTHTAGFPQAPFPPLLWNDREARLARFASWRLNWEPGTRFEYHPSSSLWVLAEIIERRAGLDFRDFIRARITEPLGLRDLFVGLPEAENRRVADIVHVGEEPGAEEYARLGFPVPPENEVNEENLQRFNRPDFRAVGVPGGGGVGTAASLALFYQALLAGGAPVWKPEIVERARQVHTGDLVDPMFGKAANRGLGVVLAGDEARTFRGFGKPCSPGTFGHNGAGGQIGWADPATGISFACCTNGFDRNPMRMGRRLVSVASRAAACAA